MVHKDLRGWRKDPVLVPCSNLHNSRRPSAGALTVAGQWRSYTAFPSIPDVCRGGLRCPLREQPLQHGTHFHAMNIYRRSGAAESKCAEQRSLPDHKKILLGCNAGRNGDPGKTRTSDTQFRKLLLYPPELRGHNANCTRQFQETAGLLSLGPCGPGPPELRGTMQIVRGSFRKLLDFSRSALAGRGHLSYGATKQIVRSSFRKLLDFSRSALAGRGHLSCGATMQIVRSSFRKLLDFSRSALAGRGHLSCGATTQNRAINRLASTSCMEKNLARSVKWLE